MGQKPNEDNIEKVIAIGASAGGIEAVQKLLKHLPKDFSAPILIVIHLSPDSPSMLPAIFSRASGRHVVQPENEESIKPGCIYIAPPDLHMIVSEGRIHLDRGPKENRHRPAVDPLFRSIAHQFGPKAIGVILSGSLDDGTAGLQAIKMCGGKTVVQHPEDAMAPGMPESALRVVDVDHCVPLAKIADLLGDLVQLLKPNPPKRLECEEVALETRLQTKLMNPREMQHQLGPPSGFICPECNGPLWEIREGRHHHFRCLVGHHFSPESFLAEETEALERALWVSIKTLEERSTLLRRLAARSKELGQTGTWNGFQHRAEESEEHAASIRRILQKLQR